MIIKIIFHFLQKTLDHGEGEMKEYLGLLKDSLSIDRDLFGKKPERTRWLKLNLYNKAPLFLDVLDILFIGTYSD